MTTAGEIDGFLAKYSPALRTQFEAARAALRRRFPRGWELVYDNYNALVFGFAFADRASASIVSVAGYPRWVTLFFLEGKALDDPERRLVGTGATVRSVRLAGPQTLEEPAVQALLAQAIGRHQAAFAAAPPLSTVVKSVADKQRPRRPPAPPSRR